MVERSGRYIRTLKSGLVFIVSFIDRLANMLGQYGHIVDVVSATSAKAKFGDTLWRCRTSSPLTVGQKVEVTGYDDMVLIVKHVD